MENNFLIAYLREEKGKNAVKRLRKEGYVTANLYGKDKENRELKLPVAEIVKRFGKDIKPSSLINLQIGRDTAGGTHTVIIKEWQKDEVKSQFLHIGFQEINAQQKIRLEIPIHLNGQAIGLRYGGIVQQPLRTIEIEAKAFLLPAQIDVDISDLEIGEQITVGRLPRIDGITYLNDSEEVVVAIVLASKEEEEKRELQAIGV